MISLGARPADAADIVQETMIRAHRKWGTLTNPYPWCRTTARHLYYRRAFSAEEPMAEFPASGTSLVASNEDAIAKVIERIDTIRLMRGPPLSQRTVLALTLDGATPAEIAADLGREITSQQVRDILRLARKAMHKKIVEVEAAEEGDG